MRYLLFILFILPLFSQFPDRSKFLEFSNFDPQATVVVVPPKLTLPSGPAASLTEFFIADSGITLGTSPDVSQWDDLAPLDASPMTQAVVKYRPHLVDASHGKKALSFIQADSMFLKTIAASINTDDLTFFAVVKALTSGGDDKGIFTRGIQGNQGQVIFVRESVPEYKLVEVNTGPVVDTTSVINTWHIFGLRYNDTTLNYRFYINGTTSEGTFAGPAKNFQNGATATIGAQEESGGQDKFFQGEISCIVYYDSAISDAHMSAVSDSLNSYYGIY